MDKPRKKFVFLGNFSAPYYEHEHDATMFEFTIETILLLLCLKLLHPESIHLIRGSYENNWPTSVTWEACDKIYESKSERLKSAFCKVFLDLPIACIIQNKILGISSGIFMKPTLEKVNSKNRRIDLRNSPQVESIINTSQLYIAMDNIGRWEPTPSVSGEILFGPTLTGEFLSNWGLEKIVCSDIYLDHSVHGGLVKGIAGSEYVQTNSNAELQEEP